MVRGSACRVDVRGGVLARTGEQIGGVTEHERVVIGVHDPAAGRGPLGDLVGVVRGGQARADVEELRMPARAAGSGPRAMNCRAANTVSTMPG